MRKDDIDEYLQYIKEEKEYLFDRYGKGTTLLNIDKPKIYSVVNLLRTVIEYAYNDIIDQIVRPNISSSERD